MSSFWYLGVPAAMLGLGYYLWNSHGFVGAQIRQVLTPIVSFVARLFSGLI
jgi:hypothetical protein